MTRAHCHPSRDVQQMANISACARTVCGAFSCWSGGIAVAGSAREIVLDGPLRAPTCDCGICGSASLSPPIVRRGLNHSRPAVSVPIRASRPADRACAANREKIAASYV